MNSRRHRKISSQPASTLSSLPHPENWLMARGFRPRQCLQRPKYIPSLELLPLVTPRCDQPRSRKSLAHHNHLHHLLSVSRLALVHLSPRPPSMLFQ